MPYKNPDKQKAAMRKISRRYRSRQKEKRAMMKKRAQQALNMVTTSFPDSHAFAKRYVLSVLSECAT